MMSPNLLPCMNWIALPVRPPTLFSARPAEAAVLLTAEPAELVTLESPCWALPAASCALPAASDAPSLALDAPVEAALLAVSVVLDAARRWIIHLDCLSASRGTAADGMMMREIGGVWRMQWQLVESSNVAAGRLLDFRADGWSGTGSGRLPDAKAAGLTKAAKKCSWLT